VMSGARSVASRRPWRAAAVLLAAAALAGASLAVPAFSATPLKPLTAVRRDQAITALRLAIEDEYTALGILKKKPLTAADKSRAIDMMEYAHGQLVSLEKELRDGGEEGTQALEDVAAAAKLDLDAIPQDVRGYPQRHELVKAALVQRALPLKSAALKLVKDVSLAAPTPAPPPTPAPTIGPLTACVYTVNGGSTTDEHALVADPGGAGLTGTVNFNGQGENVTKPITLDANGMADASVTETVFGTSTVTVVVTLQNAQPQMLTFPFTLGQANDVTQTTCAPHQ